RSGWEWNSAHMRHGEAWRVRRRFVHQRFGASSPPRMEGLLRHNVAMLVHGFLETPGEFRHHVRRFAAANIIKAVYGIDIAPRDDPYVAIAERAVDLLGVVVPGSNLVDVFPLLRFVPPWVPFFGRSTRLAKQMRPYPTAMIEVPYARARDDMEKGVAQQCMVTDLLSADISENIVKEAGAVSYLGGADTMVSTMLAVVLSMVIHPDIQSRAQAELDAVLDSGESVRLPTLSDIPRLPYIEAIVNEAYRQYPVVPLCVPHAVEADDMYEGMLIPRGPLFHLRICLSWRLRAILHDPDVYPDPQKFDPTRWLAPDPPPNPRTAVFGFGRRICPGRHFADASVFLVVASILKCFWFSEIPDKKVSGELHTSLVR
ncbi:cytochrome P450, partial [Auricularia subglabra TFB-10046 SS5]